VARKATRPPIEERAGLRLLIDEAKRAAKVTREVSLSDVAELSILRVAQREMGIK